MRAIKNSLTAPSVEVEESEGPCIRRAQLGCNPASLEGGVEDLTSLYP